MISGLDVILSSRNTHQRQISKGSPSTKNNLLISQIISRKFLGSKNIFRLKVRMINNNFLNGHNVSQLA